MNKLDTNPRFSVVICTYNDAIYLSKAIESVIDQEFSNWELIIVNDGSTDDTFDILTKFKFNPKIHVISRTDNRGKAFCLNVAIQAAKGTWMVELDSDDWLSPNALEVLERVVDARVEAYYGNYAEWREHFRDKTLTFSKVIKGMPFFHANNYLENAYPLAPRIYRLNTLRKIGGWHTEDMYQSRFYEDVYMLCAISKQGKVEHVDELLYHRRLRRGSITAGGHSDMFKKWKEWVVKELFK